MFMSIMKALRNNLILPSFFLSTLDVWKLIQILLMCTFSRGQEIGGSIASRPCRIKTNSGRGIKRCLVYLMWHVQGKRETSCLSLHVCESHLCESYSWLSVSSTASSLEPPSPPFFCLRLFTTGFEGLASASTSGIKL